MAKRRFLAASEVSWKQKAGGGNGTATSAQSTPTGGTIYASSVIVIPTGGISERDAQRALQGLDGRKLNRAGGSMTGILFLLRAPVEADSDLTAATKGYVDGRTDNLFAQTIEVRDLSNMVIFLVNRLTEAGHFGDVTRPHIRYSNPLGVQVDQATLWPPIIPLGANRYLYSPDGLFYSPARFVSDDSGEIMTDDNGDPIMEVDA